MSRLRSRIRVHDEPPLWPAIVVGILFTAALFGVFYVGGHA